LNNGKSKHKNRRCIFGCDRQQQQEYFQYVVSDLTPARRSLQLRLSVAMAAPYIRDRLIAYTKATYDASGNKLSKTVKTGATINSIQDYVMGVEYNKLGTEARKIESVYHSEGRYFNTSTTSTTAWRTEYSIKDHLGNSRISFTDKNLNGKIDVDNTVNNEILQESHYYSFGMGFDGTWQINDAAKDNYYMYNSKELNIDHALNWSDYGARWYDACLGRWSCVDPLADKYIGWSPYNYVMNNPISKIDPDGMDVWDALSRLQSRVRNNQYEEERKSAKEDNDVVANNHKSGQESGSGSISAQSGVDYNCDCGCPGMPPCKNKSSSEISRGIDLLISTIRTGLGMSPNTGSETGDKNLQQMMLLMPLFGGIGTKNKVTSNALRFSELDKLTFLKFTESWIGKGGDIIARGNKIEDLSRLLMQYGGKTDDWAKMTGKPLIRKGFTIEVHWY